MFRGSFFQAIQRLRQDQGGQALVLVIAVAPFLIALAMASYNIGETVGEKISAQNAADAAAYSGAVWRARQLNFVAYTNRVMAADYGLVGIIVSLKANAHFLEDTWDVIGTIVSLIPYVGVVINRVVSVGLDVYVRTADAIQPAIIGIDNHARAISWMQYGFVRAVNGLLAPVDLGQPQVVEDIVEDFDPQLQVEPLVGLVDGWNHIRSLEREKRQQMLDVSRAQMPDFWQSAKANLLLVRYSRETNFLLQRPRDDIVAREKWEVFSFGGIFDGDGWDTLYRVTAKASDAYAGFEFFPYVDFTPARKRLIQEDGLYPSFNVLVKKESAGMRSSDVFGLEPESGFDQGGLLSPFSGKLWAFARAEVVYTPRGSEQANLFNPYWVPRLAHVSRFFQQNPTVGGLMGELTDTVFHH